MTREHLEWTLVALYVQRQEAHERTRRKLPNYTPTTPPHLLCQDKMITIRDGHLNKRLLVTDRMTGIARHEVTVLEISPSRKRVKLRNELHSTKPEYWEEVSTLEILEVLP